MTNRSTTEEVDLSAPGDVDPDTGDDNFTQGPRVRGSCQVILKMDGSNYTAWRTCISGALDADEYALAVTMGTLTPPDPDKAKTPAGKAQQKRFDAGNRAARHILFASLQTALSVSLFSNDSDTIQASEMWRTIVGNFSKTNGGLKQLAISKFLAYKYRSEKPAADNLFRFDQIVSHNAQLGFTIPEDFKITVLLGSLPSSWEPFRQAFMARDEASRRFSFLVVAIQTEAQRRGNFDTKEVEALFSKLGTSRGNNYRKRNFRNYRQQHPQTNSTPRNTSDMTCFNCQKKGHMKAQCRAPRRDGSGPSGQQGRQQPRRFNNRARSSAQANLSEALIAEWTPFEANNCTTDIEYVLDSGANCHMINTKTNMSNYTTYQQKREIRLGGARTLMAKGSGDATIIVSHKNRTTTIRLKKALLVPNLRRNLISLSQLTDDGFNINVTPEAMILTNGNLTVRAKRCNGLYILNGINNPEGNTADTPKRKVSLDEVHRTFAHINAKTLKQMLERKGYEVIPDFVNCNSCLEAKMPRASFTTKPDAARAPRIGWIHSDVCSVSTRSYGGHHHFLTLTDDFSRFRKIYFIRSKTEVTDRIIQFMRWFKLRTGQHMYHLHSDNGTEFTGKRLQKALQDVGCDFSSSPPYTPELNGVSERLNRTLLNLARAMIQDSQLNKPIWAEAVNFAAHLTNCCQFIEELGKTPYELITGHKPFLGRIQRFGTRCYYYDRRPGRGKLDQRAIAGAIVGIDEDGLSYRVLELGTPRIHRVRDVKVTNQPLCMMTLTNCQQPRKSWIQPR